MNPAPSTTVFSYPIRLSVRDLGSLAGQQVVERDGLQQWSGHHFLRRAALTLVLLQYGGRHVDAPRVAPPAGHVRHHLARPDAFAPDQQRETLADDVRPEFVHRRETGRRRPWRHLLDEQGGEEGVEARALQQRGHDGEAGGVLQRELLEQVDVSRRKARHGALQLQTHTYWDATVILINACYLV